MVMYIDVLYTISKSSIPWTLLYSAYYILIVYSMELGHKSNDNRYSTQCIQHTTGKCEIEAKQLYPVSSWRSKEEMDVYKI